MEPLLNDTMVESEDSCNHVANKHFILANTTGSSVEEIRDKHIIPVFAKDNEQVISHTDFIEAAEEVVGSIYSIETVSRPVVRLSHPIKGRIPTARNKPAYELLENEKTLYYERMAFVIEIPTINEELEGNTLSLTVGGVKAFNLDNLYQKKGADEAFKIFVGFKHSICTNLCITTDGFRNDVKVRNVGELKAVIKTLVESYNAAYHIHSLKKLIEYSLSEQQFAQIVGRCRLYQYLPQRMKSDVTPLLLSDTQLNTVAKDFYRDRSFCKDSNGNLSLWRLYNLFTGANKSSYIDTFLDRNVNSFQFVEEIKYALEHKSDNWFLN
jgi:hypothetical protein